MMNIFNFMILSNAYMQDFNRKKFKSQMTINKKLKDKNMVILFLK